MSEAYWTVSSGVSTRVGYSCRECRKVISKGEAIKVREGRKMRFYYHDKCFSGKCRRGPAYILRRTSLTLLPDRRSRPPNTGQQLVQQ